MKLILNNPYRIAGLLIGATAREQTRQITRLKQYLEAEQQPEEDFSFPILGNLNRTLKQVEEAESNLNFDSDKIKAALFWFWNGNPITDEVAFQALQDGDIIRAIEIWTDLIDNGEVTQRNASAYHNLSVLYLSGILLGTDMYETVLDNRIYLKLQFLEEIVETKSIDSSLLIDIISKN